jgi:membrane protease YdiL (CAAX protease family)
MLWSPGIVAFGFRIVTGTGFSDLSLELASFFWLLPLAWLVPILMEVILIIFVTRIGLAQLDATLIQFRKGTVHISSSIQLLLGTQKQSYWRFALNLLVTVTVGGLLMLLFAFPEEFGWRGFLQKPLIESMGLGSGLMFGGLLWGVWHTPIILSGFKFAEYPKLGAFVFWPIFTICLAIIHGWLFWQSGSLLLPVVFSASTKVSGRLSSIALGEAGDSRRVRIVWLWLWATLAVFILALWQVGGISNL